MYLSLLLRCRTLLALIVIAVSISGTYAQHNAQVLNLEQAVEDAETIEAKVKAMNDLSWELRYPEPERSLSLAEQALALANDAGLDYLSSFSHNLIAIYHKNKGEYDVALPHLTKSLAIRVNANDSDRAGQTALNIGNIYHEKGAFDTAVTYYSYGLSLTDSAANPKHYAKLLNALGITYMVEERYEKALPVLYRSLNMRRLTKDSFNLAKSYMSLGNYFQNTGNLQEANNYYQKAEVIYRDLNYHKYRGEVLQNIGWIEQQQGKPDLAMRTLLAADSLLKIAGATMALADLHGNIGVLYLALNQPDSALPFLQNSYTHNLNAKRIYDAAIAAKELGVVYNTLEQPDSAFEYFKKGLQLSKNTKTPSLTADIYHELSKLFQTLEKPDSAAKYARLYFTIRDSILQGDINSAYLERQLAVTVLEKENQLAALELESSQRKQELAEMKVSSMIWYGTFIGAILILMVIVGFLRFRNLKQKSLLTNQQLESVLQQRAVDSFDAMLEGQEKERLRIAQDLHDELGALLSTQKIVVGLLVKESDPTKVKTMRLLDKASVLVQKSTQKLRQITEDLKTGILDEFGLVPALKDLCKSTEIKETLEINLHASTVNEFFPRELERPILKIICEGLNNVIKHARASSATVQLLQNDDRVQLSIEDDGVGFDMNNIKRGNGISHIKNRAEKYNGKVRYDSRPGHGTTLLIDFDIKNNHNDEYND